MRRYCRWSAVRELEIAGVEDEVAIALVLYNDATKSIDRKTGHVFLLVRGPQCHKLGYRMQCSTVSRADPLPTMKDCQPLAT